MDEQLAIHKAFERIAVARGADIAVRYRGEEITYQQLESRANALAGYLRQLSVRHGDIVAVLLPRSAELYVTLLAILKCGAAYLPLDEANPPQRNAALMQAAGANLFICCKIPDPLCAADRMVVLVSEFPIDGSIVESFESQRDDKAYVMFTSGSTGAPKAVVVPHRAVVRLVVNTNYISIERRDRILQLAPPSFDASTFEIWGALLNGATLVPYSGSTVDPNQLRIDMEANKITILWLTAGLFSVVAEHTIDTLRSLRVLLAGGDVLNSRYVTKVLDYIPGIIVINGYGPTENTTFTCCHVMTSANKPGWDVPIGKPIRDTDVHILDELLRPVKAGSVGELYASGAGVALGYLNEQDSEAFFLNKRVAPGLIYKTGDLVKEDKDGEMRFVGRRDNLVKVRGHRVSLDEVRKHIVAIEGVVDALVVKRDLPFGDQVLVAYLSKKEGSDVDERIIRLCLAEQIPRYMVPGRFIWGCSLAINANGKIDRAKVLR